jgi:O-succinylbenzoic acid--CoA ligase
MTESCGGVIYDGTPLDGISLSIIDGRIALQGKQIALGYLEKNFELINGWYVTQDLGEIVHGKVRVLGRADDQIISGGEKISLSAIEGFLQSQFATDQIVAFAQPHSAWGEQLCIATTSNLSLEAMSPLLKERFGSHAAPKKLFRVSSIPYLSIGKPDRKKLANDNA